MWRRLSLTTLLSSALCLPSVQAAPVTFDSAKQFQIILSSNLDVTKPLVPDAAVWDVDLFDTPQSTIKFLKGKGKTVVCYFSAGSYENWRSDAKSFAPADMGNNLSGWPGEKWLNISSPNVRSIMANRIKLAATKGCDAIDPDNIDVYGNKNGLGVTKANAVSFVQFLAGQASSAGMQIGLKNAMEILPQVASLVQFAVNEQCAANNECNLYNSFLASKKPVYHIEYPDGAPSVAASDRNSACNSAGTTGMTTVLKNMNLNGWVQYCSGTSATSPTL